MSARSLRGVVAGTALACLVPLLGATNPRASSNDDAPTSAQAAAPHSAPSTVDGPVHGGLTVLMGSAFALDSATARSLVRAQSPRVLAVAPKGCASGAAEVLACLAPELDTRELDPEDTARLNARDWSATIARSDAVLLLGGQFLDWHKLFTPFGKPTRLHLEVRAFHDRGGTVLGTGAAAGFLAAWTLIERDRLEKPRRDPHDHEEHALVGGLGFVPRTCVQPASGAKASCADLLEVLRRTPIDRALSLDPHSAWIHDPTTGITRVEGPGVSALFDSTTARRSRGTLRGGRLVLVGAGDRLDTRRARLIGERTPASAPVHVESVPEREVEDVGGHALLVEERQTLAPGFRAHVLVDAALRLRLSSAENSASLVGRSTPTEVGFDLELRLR